MAPDKIFISIERTYGASNGQVIAMATPHNERQSVNDIEYIRKDALLDFLKKKVNEIEIAMETGADDPVLWGQRNAFKQVIDKLNSM